MSEPHESRSIRYRVLPLLSKRNNSQSHKTATHTEKNSLFPSFYSKKRAYLNEKPYLCNKLKRRTIGMGKIKELWNYIKRHKYAVTIGLFLLVICITDENNVIKRLQHRRQIHELKREIAVYEDIRDKSVKGLQELANDSNNLERIARERYGMHLPNEEVFIIK